MMSIGITFQPHHSNALLTGAPGPLMMSAAKGGGGSFHGNSTPEEAFGLLFGAASILDHGAAHIGATGDPQTLSPLVTAPHLWAPLIHLPFCLQSPH